MSRKLAALIVGMVLLGVNAVWAQDPAQVAKGRQVYADRQCNKCHAIGDEGGKVGPDLTRVGLKREADWLRQFLKNPKAVSSRAKMLTFEGTDQELEAVVAYLASLY